MKIKKIQKKFIIKIPENISVVYSKKKKLITFVGSHEQIRSFKLNTQIFWIPHENAIKISAVPFSKISSNEKKTLKARQGTAVSLIKYLLIELSISFFCRKMKFIGVGYRAFPLEISEKKLLHLRLGYSHQIYFRFLNELNFFCFKFTKLFIFGNSYQHVTQFSALIRSCKPPEPYKGKGILHENEKVLLKIGKRV
uniref:Ribosomal protein L6 n=1 Tax=Eunotia naegelii TaxID=1458866 RepID=A0A2U9GII9_9STRA|nr:ribosomal protein L6 [Eunotia naegelii]AWQ64093.1 ribosomal protein L6 [Eunotia naegelii]